MNYKILMLSNKATNFLENMAYKITKHTIEEVKNTLEEYELIVIYPNSESEIETAFKMNIQTPLICITNDFDLAIFAMQKGAYISIQDSINTNEKLKSLIEEICKKNKKRKMLENDSKMSIIAKSESIQIVLKTLKQLKHAHTITLTGSVGVGKKFIALHLLKLWQKKYILIDCENNEMQKTWQIIENEISANSQITFIIIHPEQLTQAHQQKLLNIMQGTIGNNLIQWIFTVNQQDESNLVSSLKQRLSIFNVTIPTLAQRKEDIPNIVRIFQRNLSKILNKKPRKINIDEILKKTWTTNFIQLKLYIEQMFYIEHKIDEVQLSNILLDDEFLKHNLKNATTLFEQIYLQKQLALNENNIQKASTAADINRTTFYRKMKDLKQ